MRFGLAIARADYPAATPPLKPNISSFRDRPFHFHELAQGGVAVALHANDAVAQAYTGNHLFFQCAYPLMTKWLY